MVEPVRIELSLPGIWWLRKSVLLNKTETIWLAGLLLAACAFFYPLKFAAVENAGTCVDSDSVGFFLRSGERRRLVFRLLRFSCLRAGRRTFAFSFSAKPSAEQECLLTRRVPSNTLRMARSFTNPGCIGDAAAT